MRFRAFTSLAIAAAMLALMAGNARLAAQGGSALTGVVTSPQEGKMEGVVVSARREGSVAAVSVVSGNNGKYTFPRTHLAPGKYTITIRAAGYDLTSASSVDVPAGKTAKLDLKLDRAKDLASQLSSLEWLISTPAPEEAKERIAHQLLSCAYCHTYERILKSKHSPEQFATPIARMAAYFPDGAASSRDGRGRALRRGGGQNQNAQSQNAANQMWGVVPGMPRKEIQDFFAQYNLSGGRTTWNYELKTLPRPKGKATRVIITQYDMPRKDTVPHDSDIDSKGRLWYADQSAQFIGMFDPKTETFKEVALPPVPANTIPGAWDVQIDKNDNVWFPMRTSKGGNALTRYEPATGTLTSIEGVGGQFLSFSSGDGSVWQGSTRIDVNKAAVAERFTLKEAKGYATVPPGSGGYHNVIDSKGNTWEGTYRGPGGVIAFFTKTNEVKWYPIPGLAARRGKIDRNDVYWFAEYLTDKITMFDTKTGQHKRWDVMKWSTPYTATTPDSKGRVYAPSNMSERLIRLDPKTGDIVEYLIPTDFDTKKIAYDPTTKNPVLWMANTRNARIVRVEPLD